MKKDKVNPKISIIVPVYRVEFYLKKCIDSILNQTFKDFELILVNDGSPDNCGEICDEYAEKDSRITVIHKKNGGQASAKNMALLIAKGKYIGFVDSDDWIDCDMYHILYNMIETSKKDIANISLKSIGIFGEKVFSIHDRIILDREKAIEELFKHKLYGNFFCTNLFRRELFKEMKFKEGIAYEDVDLLYRLIHISNGIVTLGVPKYNYLIRQGSTTGDGKKRIDFYRVMEKQKKWLKEHYPIIYRNVEKKINNGMNLCAFVYICYLRENNEIRNNLEDFYKYSKFVNNHFRENMFSKKLIWKTKLILIILKISPNLFRVI
ncbi:MAG: glycosyltransferase family 2 protein [Cetobacterium sp.]